MAGVRSTFEAVLLRWYDRCRRDLPWREARGTRPDPYAVLVSEIMLQQTQVATVIPYFHRFMQTFPTVGDLAGAPEQSVLRLWQGLGYYSRARNLQAAARTIVAEHRGAIPSDFHALLSLPGVGRYTAGAIASIAFDLPRPILDGNVARVLCRLDGIRSDPRQPKTIERLWKRAEEILPARRCGDFNSALMELGATICAPRSPDCAVCPLRQRCRALAAGLQDKIPLPRKRRPTPLVKRWTFAIGHRRRWLIERRPPRGRWAGLWQFVTVPAHGKVRPEIVAELIGFDVAGLRPLGRFEHALTHRRYVFNAFSCTALTGASCGSDRPRRWVTMRQLAQYPLPRPQLKIAQLILEKRL